MHNFKEKLTAFTLVELIVVITILAILATIGFVSFQGYGVTSRDAVRLADMRSIEKGFSIKLTKGEQLPIPDDKIDITASGTLLTYQGYAGVNLVGNLGIHGEVKDPIDNTYYTYSTNTRRNKYQLLGFFESEENISFNNHTYADLAGRYPRVKGDELGIILDSITKEPIQEESNNIDIVNTNDDLNFVINNISDGNFIGSGSTIIHKWSDSLDAGSCEEILNNFSSEYLENKKYPIISNTGEEIEVFCDMENGGFTGLFSVNPAGTTWRYDSNEWINPTIKENNFLTQETTLKSYADFDTKEIRICRGNLESCFTMNHGENISLNKFYTDNITHIEYSEFKYLDNYDSEHHYNNNGPINIGSDVSIQYLTQLGLTTSVSYLSIPRYSKFGFGINLYERNKLGFQADNNNSWPGFDNFSVGIGGFAPYSNGTTTCIGGYPHPYSRATSIHISGQECYIDNPDTVMWYVLGK